MSIAKAAGNDFDGRFREILSDPINLLIDRVRDAGLVVAGEVVLHNGNRVACSGSAAYYEDFSKILVLNRGVHEPLEEYCFQQVLRDLRDEPVMIELGSYWAHYSMWLKRRRPKARAIMVEPDEHNIDVGRQNFALNGFEGEFIPAFVDHGGFEIDTFRAARGIAFIDIIHADIQGHEVAMLEGAKSTLAEQAAGRIFVSTHSQELHARVTQILERAQYRIDVTSDFDFQTTSFDGLVVASRQDQSPLFADVLPLGRSDITDARPQDLLENLIGLRGATEAS